MKESRLVGRRVSLEVDSVMIASFLDPDADLIDGYADFA